MKHSVLHPFVPGGETIIVRPQSAEDYVLPAALLADGQLVAFPTETVYGLGAIATDPSAVAKIFAAKGRPGDNPLIVHVARIEDIPQLVREITPLARCLMRAFMPGPITLVMKKNSKIPDLVSAGLPTVGIRMPSHPVALRLLSAVGAGVAAPSANLSGSPSPTKAEHVMDDLRGRIPCIVDGGPCEVGLESTVVDVTGTVPVILRPGAITREMIENVCRDAGLAINAVADESQKLAAQTEKPRAPGMKYRHYAPKAKVTIISGNDPTCPNTPLLSACRDALSDPQRRIGIFCGEEASKCMKTMLSQSELSRTIFYVFGENGDIQSAARLLFDGLRSLDAADVEHIFAVGFPGDGLERAYMNRLKKAALGTKESGESSAPVGDVIKNVLFVCTGNTCRSPMAEAAFQTYVKSRGPYSLLEDDDRFVRIIGSSAGIFADEGSSIADNAITAAKELFAYDLSGKRSTKTVKSLIGGQDMIFAMTNEHASLLKRFFPESASKIYSFSEYFSARGIFVSPEQPLQTEVIDPYGRPLETYRNTAEQIRALIIGVWPYLMKDLGVKDWFI